MLVGKDLGPYTVEKELGSGAMGTVFRGKSKTNGELVAIKLMSLALGSSDTAVARFKREVDILKQLRHPNIVGYKASGRYHGAPFFIMEFVEGESLDHILERRGRLTWEEVVELGCHLCAALQHAHDKGIIHRDLKPSNLMILLDGTVKLTDFGIAKDTDVTALTAANSTVGTAAYMSPEQCRGVRDITHKTDLYSMGIMFYELLTGRKPFVGETAMEVFLQHANKTDFKRPAQIVLDVPIWLDNLVCQLMEKDPAKRPISATMVADTLKGIKDKVEAQKSAGIEAATKRRIDRTPGETRLDDADKDIARTMLGKKKKKKKAPFYSKGWFTVTALGGVAIALGAFVYYAFFMAPSADSLYRQAEALMKTDKLEARKGPITDFLTYHRDHEKASVVQRWADDVDFELADRQLHRRRNNKIPVREGQTDREEETLARDALDKEDAGQLAKAALDWDKLSKKKGNADPEIHAWGLIGEHYLRELQKVDESYILLKQKIGVERLFPGRADKKAVSSDPLEQLAIDAVRDERNAETAKDSAEIKKYQTLAKSEWEDLKGKNELPRRWFLLSAKRVRELSGGIEKLGGK